MRVDIKSIGESWTIRISSSLIKRRGRGKAVELRVIIESHDTSPSRPPRQGWKESFASAPQTPLDETSPTTFDECEWTW